MGTVVSKRRNPEVSESTAVKIRVVAAFQGNCKDNSGSKEGLQLSSSATESTTAAADDKSTLIKQYASVANTKFPKGVYPQRESNLSLPATSDKDQHDYVQPYRLKLGIITASGTHLYPNDALRDNDKLQESTAVVQLYPRAATTDDDDNTEHNRDQETGKIPDELDWLLKKGVTGAEMHGKATIIQKTVRGYQCRKKLIKEVKSAAMIQRNFRQWRRNSSLYMQRKSDGQISVPTNSIYSKRKSDGQIFVPTNSITTAPYTSHNNNKDHMNNKPSYSTEEVGVEANLNSLYTTEEVIDANDDNNNCCGQQLKTKPLHSIDENAVSITDDELLTNSSSVTASSDNNDSSAQANSEIISVLKEVCNMPTPDIQLPHESDLQVLGDKTREYLNDLYHSSILRNARNKPFNIGKEQFRMYFEFQNEIDETMFLAQQKAELTLGESYVPRKVLLISSRVPKVNLLQCAILPDIITFVYDFERATYYELINKIANALDDYKQGAKIKNLGIICKGGPGHLYLFANKPVTPVKLVKDHKMMTFWKVLGVMMSKLAPEETFIHFMESNVDGNKQGEQLLKDMEKLMYPSKVNIKCPLEVAASGQKMISTYFDPPKYRLWKQNRYTKLKLY